jgi:two-component system, NtrC family, nitrogen regulation sensor histidine kinase NtrY
MVSKYYYLNIIFGVLILSVTAMGLGVSLFNTDMGMASILISLLLLIESVVFIAFLNKINKKIASFFNSVQNEDTAFNIPLQSKNKVIQELHKNLNKFIEVFREIKMGNEFREQLYLAMIEHSATGFISIDEYGDFEIMNETSRKLLGVAYTSSLPRLETENPELFQVITSLKPGEIKSCKVSSEETNTIVQVSLSVLKFKDKSLKLVSFQDIKKEIELRELESWQKLIRIMNHEIMNSIAPITSVSKSLMKIYKYKEQPITSSNIDQRIISDTITGLEVIDNMSSGLSHFVNNYRQLSQIPKPLLKEIYIAKWAEYFRIITEESIAQNNAEFNIHTEPDCKKLLADEKLLNQVLINLIKNAAEAPKSDVDKRIELKIKQTETNKIRISVSNNGLPINPDVLDKIFVPFFTTKESGAGIGLFISRQIVSLHGGTISVMSNDTEGTTFTIEL